MPGANPVTMVNHVAIAIAAPPDAVWRIILDDYVGAAKFRQDGATIDPIDEPAAIHGGYRLQSMRDGIVVDERNVRITERDEAALRLSAAADYLSVPGGMQVYATYHAQAADGGTRYAIDCHSVIDIALLGGGSKAEIAAALTAMIKASDAHLMTYLESAKARAEQGDVGVCVPAIDISESF